MKGGPRNGFTMGYLAVGAVALLVVVAVVEVVWTPSGGQRVVWAITTVWCGLVLLVLLGGELARRAQIDRHHRRAARVLDGLSLLADNRQPGLVPNDLIDELSERIRSEFRAADVTVVVRDIASASGHDGRLSVQTSPTHLIVRLTVDDEDTGAIDVAPGDGVTYSNSDRSVLEIVAARVAGPIGRELWADAERRARLAAEDARRLVELVLRSSGALAPSLEHPDAALEDVARIIVEDRADFCAIDLVGNDGDLRRLVTRHADPSAIAVMDEAAAANPSWQQPVRDVMAAGSPLFVEAADGDANRELGAVMTAGGLSSWMIVAIRVRGLSYGAFTVATASGHRALRPADVRAVEDIAVRAAAVIERSLLYREAMRNAEEAEDRAGRLGRLIDATIVLNRDLRPGALLEAVVDRATHVLDASYAMARLDDSGWLPAERGTWDADASSASTPLIGPSGSGVGELVVQRPADQPLTIDDQAILTVLARLASVAVQNARLYDDVSNREQRLEALIQASPLAILELSVFGAVRNANPASIELFGPTDTDDDGVMQLPPALAGELAALAPRAARGEHPQIEMTLETDNGPIELWATMAGLHDSTGLVTGALAIISDITRRKALEQQLLAAQRFEAVAQLAGGVAHDFNNLLTVIVGYSQILMRRFDDDAAERELVEPIYEAGRHASVITNQLLTLSRNQVMHPVVVQLGELVDGLLPMLRRLAGERVKVEARVHSREASVTADAGQLEQVLLNLVLNSRDATPRDGVIVVEVAEEDSHVVLRVADTGKGMDPETLARCCEPFYTTKGPNRGTGLGLATVKTVVDRSGGTLDIESTVGEGTTITARFRPRSTADDAPVVEEPRRATTVLVVDDDEPVRRVAVEVLAGAGYDVFTADDGESAIAELLESDGVDVVVSDVVMPGMSGIDLARVIARRWPSTPVLLVTGYAGSTERVDGELAGPVLAKPFTADALLRAVSDALVSRS